MSDQQDAVKEDGLEVWLSENASKVMLWVLAVALLIMLGFTGAYFAFFLSPPLSIDPATLGQAGDYFGGLLNPALSFLSVFALLVALVIQTRELKLSREALKVSQEEQAKAAEALDLQNKAIQQQSFEQTFFSMLRLLGEVLEDCTTTTSTMGRYFGGDADIKRERINGRSALVFLLNTTFYLDWEAEASPPEYMEHVQNGVVSLCSGDIGSYLVQYARTLVTILEYLRHSAVPSESIYPKTLRSQLSQSELRLIYFLCLDERWSVLKGAVERYGLLAYLDNKGTGAGADYANFFVRSAFQE